MGLKFLADRQSKRSTEMTECPKKGWLWGPKRANQKSVVGLRDVSDVNKVGQGEAPLPRSQAGMPRLTP